MEREITRALSREDSPKKDGENQGVRRRAKSPKRTSAPQKPPHLGKSAENKNTLFAKELEMRLSKSLDTKVNVSPPPGSQKPNPAPHPPALKPEPTPGPTTGQAKDQTGKDSGC